MELNSGLTAFADNQSDGRKSHIERYHRYDFDTKEESIEEIIVETNSFTDGETTAGYFPNGKISDIDLPEEGKHYFSVPVALVSFSSLFGQPLSAFLKQSHPHSASSSPQ